MGFVNVGAVDDRGRGFATKKALKEALAADPSGVNFFGTSDFTPYHSDGNGIPLGVTLSVVGPDPYTSRKWYATVERGRDRGIKVS